MVAGAPGAGKSTVAAALLAALTPAPAMLDKDVLFAGFVEEVLAAHGRPPGNREGEWYDVHVKRHEYGGMTAAARQIRSGGCPALLVAPFTSEIRDPQRWQEWVAELGGEPVHLVWVRCDPDTLVERLRRRGSDRDGGKLADLDAFLARMRPDEPPPVPHRQVDNRRGARPLGDQVSAAVARL